jgi:hypothetical protein
LPLFSRHSFGGVPRFCFFIYVTISDSNDEDVVKSLHFPSYYDEEAVDKFLNSEKNRGYLVIGKNCEGIIMHNSLLSIVNYLYVLLRKK